MTRLLIILLVCCGLLVLSLYMPQQPGSTTGKCQMRGVLPDPICTPGATNPNVTVINLKETICLSGWTATVRPPVSYTQKVEKMQIASYGYQNTNPIDYITDHAISLELGGNATNPVNLWPEPTALSRQDDQVENRLHDQVCKGEITLNEAQRQEMQLKYDHGYRPELSRIKL